MSGNVINFEPGSKNHISGRHNDTGRIQQIEPGEAWTAVFLMPYSPFYDIKPVIKWVNVIRNSETQVDALIDNGDPIPQFVSVVDRPDYQFYRYVPHALYDEAGLNGIWAQAEYDGAMLAQQLSEEQYGGLPQEEEIQYPEDAKGRQDSLPDE